MKINMFNEGGLHETNPLGGIPLGQNSEGGMNMVEEGEGQMGDQIYSDRIVLSPETVQSVGLPQNFAGKTAAEILEKIDNKFSERNDKISQSTKKNLADRVFEAQEIEKSKMQEQLNQNLATNSQEMEDFSNEPVPQGMQGYLPQPEEMMGGLPVEQQDTRLQTGMQDTPYNFGGFLEKTGNIAGNISSVFGAVSPIIDGIGSLFMSNTLKKRANNDMKNKALSDMYSQTSDFKYGGKKNTYYSGNGDRKDKSNYEAELQRDYTVNLSDEFGPFPLKKYHLPNTMVGAEDLTQRPEENPFAKKNETTTNKSFNDAFLGKNYNFPNTFVGSEVQSFGPEQPIVKTPDEKTNDGGRNYNFQNTFLGRNYEGLLRLAPVATNMSQLLGMKRPGFERLNRMDNRFKPEYLDERSMINDLNAETNSVNNAISQSGASTGAMRNAMIGTNYNKMKALSDAAFKAKMQNIQTNQTGQEFNFRTDASNIQQANLENDINAKNQAAFENNRSRFISQLGTDIGNFGKEEAYKKIARNTLGYTWDGRYFINEKGDKKTASQMQQLIDSKINS